MGEDLLDDICILDARDGPHCTAAGRAALDVDPENPLQALRPGHRGAAFRCRRLLRIRLAGVTRARYLLLGANTPWKRVRLTRGLGTRAANRAIKSNGSKMTCVVPARYGVFNSYRTLPFGVSDRRFRDECLNENWFVTMRQARRIIERWGIEYNEYRPHSALGYLTPAQYVSGLGRSTDERVLLTADSMSQRD